MSANATARSRRVGAGALLSLLSLLAAGVLVCLSGCGSGGSSTSSSTTTTASLQSTGAPPAPLAALAPTSAFCDAIKPGSVSSIVGVALRKPLVTISTDKKTVVCTYQQSAGGGRSVDIDRQESLAGGIGSAADAIRAAEARARITPVTTLGAPAFVWTFGRSGFSDTGAEAVKGSTRVGVIGPSLTQAQAVALEKLALGAASS